MQNIYDERIKQLEGRVSLLTQRDEDITTLLSAMKSVDPNTLMQAVSDAATRAIGAATEAVRHIENVYSNTITTLGILLAAVGILGGLLGIRQFKEAANELLKQFKEAANELLKKEVETFKTQLEELRNKYEEEAAVIARLRTNITAVITTLRKNTAVVVDDAKRNNEALTVIFASYMVVTNCIFQLRKETTATVRSQLVAGLQSSLIDTNRVIDVDKPKDDAILGWALTIRGTMIFHLQNEFERALKDFESALAISPDRGSALYNAACSACRLGLKEKALTYIVRAIQIQPARRGEAKADQDLECVQGDI